MKSDKKTVICRHCLLRFDLPLRKEEGKFKQGKIMSTKVCQRFLYPIPKYSKGHSFYKQCLHDLQFMKTRSSTPNLSKPARADISCQFMKIKFLCRHCLQNEWTLASGYLRQKVLLFFSVQSRFQEHISLVFQRNLRQDFFFF